MPTRPALDQGFIGLGARLVTTAAPYDPFGKTGETDDDARYAARPGIDFLRPWLAVRNGVAFQWPLGLEGFTLATDPRLNKHSFIGDNGVQVDVLNSGEENFTMTGTFPGDSAPALLQALRTVVRASAGEEGKILYIPEVMPHAQRVTVEHSDFSRNTDDRGRDISYSIDFVLMEATVPSGSPEFTVATIPSTARDRGVLPRTVNVDGTHNTLRKIANWKLGATTKWRQVYDANELYFVSHSIPLMAAPDYRLPLGVVIYF